MEKEEGCGVGVYRAQSLGRCRALCRGSPSHSLEIMLALPRSDVEGIYLPRIPSVENEAVSFGSMVAKSKLRRRRLVQNMTVVLTSCQVVSFSSSARTKPFLYSCQL